MFTCKQRLTQISSPLMPGCPVNQTTTTKKMSSLMSCSGPLSCVCSFTSGFGWLRDVCLCNFRFGLHHQAAFHPTPLGHGTSVLYLVPVYRIAAVRLSVINPSYADCSSGSSGIFLQSQSKGLHKSLESISASGSEGYARLKRSMVAMVPPLACECSGCCYCGVECT